MWVFLGLLSIYLSFKFDDRNWWNNSDDVKVNKAVDCTLLKCHKCLIQDVQSILMICWYIIFGTILEITDFQKFDFLGEKSFFPRCLRFQRFLDPMVVEFQTDIEIHGNPMTPWTVGHEAMEIPSLLPRLRGSAPTPWQDIAGFVWTSSRSNGRPTAKLASAKAWEVVG